MSAEASFDVIVAGRGPVGAACALGLAQAGLHVALVGPAQSVRDSSASASEWDPRVVALAPATFALLERLRVARQLDPARIAPVYDMEIHGDAPHRAGRLGFSAWDAQVAQLASIVEVRALQRALDAGVQLHPRIECIDGRIDAFTLADDAVHATLSGAPIAALRAALIVAADGAQSPTRERAGIAGVQRPYGQCGVVANFVCERPHADVAYQWFLGRSVLALLPLPAWAGAPGPSTHVSMVWSTDEAHAQTLQAATPEALCAQVEAACGARLGALRQVGATHAWPLTYFVAETLVLPRLALVGDAAHVMHPLAGQGLNAGLADVAALLEVIAQREPMRDLGDAKLLRRYARRRAEDIALLMRTTDSLQRLFVIDAPMVRRMRNVGMNLLDAVPVLKNTLVRRAIGAQPRTTP